MDYSIRICGEAGQGIQSVGDTLARIFARSGFYLFTHQDYESRIRGGHNYYQLRLSDKPVTAPRVRIDILVAFDIESMNIDASALSDGGLILYDSAFLKKSFDGREFMSVPFSDIAVRFGNRIMANSVAMGAVLGILGMKMDKLPDLIAETFRKKGEDIINANVAAAQAGYDYAVKECRDCRFSVPSPSEPLMMIAGIDAIATGAAASGCKFMAAYPMTPSTGIMNYLAGREEELSIVVEQAEDEISAFNMALGASFGGVRSMTATSGGGFALMVEGLSLAAMTETPIVIGLGQRPGPATGLPTRTEQAELLFALHAAHGEFPRIIFAPGDPEQAFFLTNRAFDLAEKYQVPVFILFDQYLADTQWTYSGFAVDKLVYTDYRLGAAALDVMPEYKRHMLNETGVSPMAIPGQSVHVVVTDSDEHDEEGHLTEDADIRKKMVEKRLFLKGALLKKEIRPPVMYGNDSPDKVLVGWGSTYGLMKEAVDLLSSRNRIAMLHFSEIWPFPSCDDFDYLSVLKNASITICVENNATGQFARLLRTETGYEVSSMINRYDGRPFTVEELLGEIDARI